MDQLISGTRILALDGNPATIAPAVRLYSGWNTIGGLSTPLCVAGLSFDPFQTDFPTRIGDVYAYETNRGYRAVSEILPGLGYWLNVDKNGFIKTDLSLCREVPNDTKQNLLENSVQVNVRDNDNKNTTLYFADESVNAKQFELPPAPPAGLARAIGRAGGRPAASPSGRWPCTTPGIPRMHGCARFTPTTTCS